MESANYHNQTGQPASSSCTTTAADWTQNLNLNNSNPKTSNPNFTNLMIQELGFNHHWNSNANQFDDNHQQIGKIKEEVSSNHSFPKFAEMLTSSNNNEEQKYTNDIISEKLLLKTISNGFPINGSNQFMASNLYPSQIYPSINIFNLKQSPASFDMNLEGSDLLTSATFSGSFEQPFTHNNVTQQHSTQIPSSNPSKIPRSSSSTKEITKSKRPSNSLNEPKEATQAAPKKSRLLDSCASCSPIKVRKEKLGDRIATLQQLVAPFGKTDTASVLMEAIGYIKFLQNQVETLSVPYMKSTRSKTTHGGSRMGEEERKKDLRGRGLCLVPLSCMSYVTGDSCGGGGIWPPPNFGGGT